MLKRPSHRASAMFLLAMCSLFPAISTTLAGRGGGYALEFAGATDYVTVGDRHFTNFIHQTMVFTVEFWFVVDSRNFGQQQNFIGNASNIAGNIGFYIRHLGNGRIRTNVDHANSSATRKRIETAAVIKPDTWMHLALAGDGGKTYLYLDGRLIGEAGGAPGSVADATAFLAFGESGGDYRDFHGRMDEIRIWRIARSHSDIQESMTQELIGDEAGLIGYWRLNEGAGTVAHDSSPSRNHGTIFGAQWVRRDDPPPSAPPLPPSGPLWSWAGAVTAHSAVVKAGRSTPPPHLMVSSDPLFEEAWTVEPVNTTAAGALGYCAEYHLETLDAETRYYYRWADQEAGSAYGQFRTMPELARSFAVAFSCCASNGSTHPVFDVIRSHDPLFFLHTGDLHYRDIAQDNPHLFYGAYAEVLITSPRQNQFFRDLHVAYMWDDHDYGPNNSDMRSPGRAAALSTYRVVVPHYPLALGQEDPEAPVGQAFSAGRVRFIMPDLRSHKWHNELSDGPEKTMMGLEQRAWLKQELLAARDKYVLIVFVSGVPWIDDTTRPDSWAGYTHERQVISDFLVEHNIDNLIMLAGDAHMVAGDDGSNNRYATGGDGPGFPVFHASALDAGGSVKGGPYSHGTFPGPGHYGLLHIDDDGETVNVTFEGRHYQNGVLVEMDFQTRTRTFEAWRRAHFIAVELADEMVSGPKATPAKDGVPNLLRYAFGQDPWDPTAAELPAGEFSPEDPNLFRLSYLERRDVRDIEYIIEISSDSTTWTTAETTEIAREIDHRQDGFDWVTVGIDNLTDAHHVFVRVEVNGN